MKNVQDYFLDVFCRHLSVCLSYGDGQHKGYAEKTVLSMLYIIFHENQEFDKCDPLGETDHLL